MLKSNFDKIFKVGDIVTLRSIIFFNSYINEYIAIMLDQQHLLIDGKIYKCQFSAPSSKTIMIENFTSEGKEIFSWRKLNKYD